MVRQSAASKKTIKKPEDWSFDSLIRVKNSNNKKDWNKLYYSVEKYIENRSPRNLAACINSLCASPAVDSKKLELLLKRVLNYNTLYLLSQMILFKRIDFNKSKLYILSFCKKMSAREVGILMSEQVKDSDTRLAIVKLLDPFLKEKDKWIVLARMDQAERREYLDKYSNRANLTVGFLRCFSLYVEDTKQIEKVVSIVSKTKAGPKVKIAAIINIIMAAVHLDKPLDKGLTEKILSLIESSSQQEYLYIKFLGNCSHLIPDDIRKTLKSRTRKLKKSEVHDYFKKLVKEVATSKSLGSVYDSWKLAEKIEKSIDLSGYKKYTMEFCDPTLDDSSL